MPMLKSAIKNEYGFIKPNGEYLYGPRSGTHDQLARQHGFGEGTVERHREDDTVARDEAIRDGWVRFRRSGDVFYITFNPANEDAKTAAEKYLLKNDDGLFYEINFKEFGSVEKALEYLRDQSFRKTNEI